MAAVVVTAVSLSGRRRIWLATLAGVVLVVAMFTFAGFDWPQAERLVTTRYYQGIASERPCSFYGWANLAALALSAGPAVAAGPAGRAGWPSARRLPGLDREHLVPATLSLAAAVAVLVADLTGPSKAETGRIWLPFAFWLIASMALLPKRQSPVRWPCRSSWHCWSTIWS